MKPLYNQLMDSKSAPQVAAKANTTQLDTAPMNLRSAMQKYARGGDVEKEEDKKQTSGGMATYDYNAPKNGDRIKIPGVAGNPEDGKVIVFWDHPNKRVVVSDEGYWNADSPVGDELKKAVKWANDQGYQAGVVTTPYASNRFGDNVRTAGGFTRMRPPASDQQLRDYVDAADFVVTDPYILDPATSTPEMQDNFASFTKNVGDYANSQGKDTWLVLQGFNTPSVDPVVTQAYNDRLANENAGRYNNLSFYTPEVFANGETPTDTQQTFSTATQAAQPFKMAQKGGFNLLPDWGTLKSNEKIDFFNQNNIDPNTLLDIGVPQQDINWMANNGYTGNVEQQQPQMMAQQAKPQEMTGIAALGGDQPGYQSSSPQPVDVGNGLRRTYGGNLIDSEGYPVDSNGQRLNNSYSSGDGGGLPEPTPEDGYSQPYVSPYTGPKSKVPDVLGNPNNSKEDIEAFNQSVFVGNPNDYGNPQITPPPRYVEPPLPVPPPHVTPAAPDYSRAYSALGGADSVNGLRNQFLQSGLDENTIGSIFSQYYAPEQPVQQMASGGMAHSDIEQYLTSLGMLRK